MKPTVGMVSLGCAKNQVDAERMLYRIDKGGYKLVSDAALADVVIINTCGFIESAKQEAIETILEFAQLKKEGRIKRVIVTGCLAQRYKDELLTEIPEADACVGLGSNDRICDIIEEVCRGERVNVSGSKLLLPLTGGRIQTTLPFYSYLKIAEGCSNGCAFCAIPQIRGKFRSVPMEELAAEAQTLAENGVRELNVIAQDSTQYGTDLYGEQRLPALLRRLCRIEKLKWIRVLYLYPERITDELIQVIAEEEKIVKYIEMPVQHCDDGVLKAMRRNTTGAQITALIEKLRRMIPDVTIRTTLMTGFPGEGDEEFERLCEFVKSVRFDRLGVFAFSPEEGTLAAKMPETLTTEEKQRRADVIMEIQADIAAGKNEALVGKDVEVLCEGFDRYGECFFGRSAADAAEIDGKVFFTAADRKPRPGDFVTVHINEVMDYDLIGEMTADTSVC